MRKNAPASLSFEEEFQKFITASAKGKRLKYLGRKLASGTLVQYGCVDRLLQEFETRQGTTYRILLLKKHSQSIVEKEKRYWRRFFSAFTQSLYQQKGCYDNYVSSVCKILKTFFNYLLEEKGYMIGDVHTSFTLPHQPFTPLVLEPSKLQFLITYKDFEASLPKHLQRSKDLFVFGCTVALRYSDLMNLQKKHLVRTPEETYLQLYTQKTSTLVKLPLPDYLLAILGKYQKLTGRFLLPRLSSTNLNLQVKDLCKRAGWDYQLPKVRYKMGKPVEIKTKCNDSLRYYEQVTTHTMRRTAITTLLVMGVPELVVRRISGHGANSKEFYRYVVIAQDFLNTHVKKAYEKLVEWS